MSESGTELLQVRNASIEAVAAFKKAAKKNGKNYKRFFDEDIHAYCRGILKKSESKPAKPEDLETILDEKFEQFSKLMEEKREKEYENRGEEMQKLTTENAELKELLNKTLAAVENLKDEKSKSFLKKIFG